MVRESVEAILSSLDDDSGDKGRKSRSTRGVMCEMEPTEDVQLRCV
jgi:hypothetical protein